MGCIVMMVTRQETDISKCITKRAAMTHDTKITKQRTSEQTKAEGVRKEKQKYSFQIKSINGNNWYNKDESEYSAQKPITKYTSKEQKLKSRIKDLETGLNNRVKVVNILYHKMLSNVIPSNLFLATSI